MSWDVSGGYGMWVLWWADRMRCMYSGYANYTTDTCQTQLGRLFNMYCVSIEDLGPHRSRAEQLVFSGEWLDGT